MNLLLVAAAEVQRFCQAQSWPFCFIGGLAIQRWGEARVTRDVDLTLLTGFGHEDQFVLPLLSAFHSRLPDAQNFARQNRVLLLTASNGVSLDISLGALPFEQSCVNRATPFAYGPDYSLRTCSAEDLIILKLFAHRPLDVYDAETIFVRQQGRLDFPYIESHLFPLAELKPESPIAATYARLRGL